MESISDEQLVKNYLNGAEDALTTLVQRYTKPLYGFVFSMVRDTTKTEDIVQESCIKLWRSIKKFDTQKKFKTWIFQIAKNTAIDHLRKYQPERFTSITHEDEEVDASEAVPDQRQTVLDKLQKAAEASMVVTAIQKLSAAHQVVLELYYYQDLNFREIAEVLQAPLDTIKSRHRRALLQLKDLLQANSIK